MNDTISTNAKTRVVEIGGLYLHVLEGLHDENWYQERHVYEERASLLYSLLAQEGFANFVDIGANYGYISMLMRLAKTDMNIVAIEADGRLSQLIDTNFKTNGLLPPWVINAIAGEENKSQVTFSINPRSSLDNRVEMEDWQKVEVDMVAGGDVINSTLPVGKTFVKIDTQGYEWRVLRGLESYLSEHHDWLLKMEFGPHWLESQGTDPVELLYYLDKSYEFAEMPARVRFNTHALPGLFDRRIHPNQFGSFVDYVRQLNKNGLGWVDLIVGRRT